MKKLLLGLAVIASLAVRAEGTADYQILYWQVDSSEVAKYSPQASYANLYASFDGGATRIGEDGRAIAAVTAPESQTTDVASWTTGSYDFTGASFYVELLNDHLDTVATSQGVSYDTLKSQFMDIGGPSWYAPVTHTGVYGFGAFAVPEPTSGLLLLFGLAGLALRRKRA